MVGEKIKLNPSYIPSNLPSPEFQWTTLDSKIVTVTPEGIVEGKSIGTGKIKLSTKSNEYCNYLEFVTKINVIQNPNNKINVTEISLSHNNYELTIGENFQLSATILPQNASNKNIIWESSNTSIISVSQNGFVSSLSEGSAKIIAKSEDNTTIYDECTFTIKSKYNGPTVKISLNNSSPESLSIQYEIDDNTAYFQCEQGEIIPESSTKHTTTKTISYRNLEPNSLYKFSAIAYDSIGRSGGIVTAEFKTSIIPYVNYVCIDGTYLELYTVEMSADHDYTGTGTGTNQKKLIFHGPKINSSVTQVRFYYSVPEWEGINKYWHDGTYYIDEDGGGYYSYGVMLLYKGNVYYGDATLNISSNGSVKTFKFEIDGYREVKGYFIGTIQ